MNETCSPHAASYSAIRAHAASGSYCVEPRLVYYEGDPDEYVIAKADERRHMTTGRRATAMATNLARRGNRQDGRWKRGRVPNSDVRNSNWQQSVSVVGLVLDHAPELAADVVTGQLTLEEARRAADDARRSDELDADALAGL